MRTVQQAKELDISPNYSCEKSALPVFQFFSTLYHKLLRLVGDIQVHILVSGCVHKLWTFDEMKSLEAPFLASEQIAQ